MNTKPIPAIQDWEERFDDMFTHTLPEDDEKLFNWDADVQKVHTFIRDLLLNEQERIVDGLILDLVVIARNTPPEKVVSEVAKKLKVLKEGGE